MDIFIFFITQNPTFRRIFLGCLSICSQLKCLPARLSPNRKFLLILVFIIIFSLLWLLLNVSIKKKKLLDFFFELSVIPYFIIFLYNYKIDKYYLNVRSTSTYINLNLNIYIYNIYLIDMHTDDYYSNLFQNYNNYIVLYIYKKINK